MSLERSKFTAGVRGVHTNAFYGSMSLGGGEGGGGMLASPKGMAAALHNARYPTVPKLSAAAAAAEMIKSKALKRRAAHSKLGMLPITFDEFTRRGAAASNRIALGLANDRRQGLAHAEAMIRKKNASERRLMQARLQSLGIHPETDWGCKSNSCSSRKHHRGHRTQRMRSEHPQLICLLPPQSNFRQCSESSSEPNASSNYQLKPKQPEEQDDQQQQEQEQMPPHVFDQQEEHSEVSAELSEQGQEQEQEQGQGQQLQPEDSGSITTGNDWSSSESFESECSYEDDGKTLKLTSTVIQIMPNARPVRAAAGDVAAKPAATAAAAKQPPASTPRPAATAATAARPKAAIKLKRQPKKLLKTAAAAQKEQAQPSPKPTTATAANFAHKIVRVDQHKVPKTIEDGIDISYQYFVSLPLARGKKPLPIRYLYRPMMRRLNQPAATATTRRRSSGKKSVSESKTDLESEQQSSQAPSSTANSEQKSDESSEDDEENDFPLPPPVEVDAKYLPFIKQLKNHPMPEEQKQQPQWADQQQQLLLEYTEQVSKLQDDEQKQDGEKTERNSEEQQQQRLQLIEEQKKQLLAKQQADERRIPVPRPVLIDFQPKVTRLSCGIGSANICYHAPIRMCAGGVATDAAGATATNASALAAELAAAADEARQQEEAARLEAKEAAARAAKEAEIAEAIAAKAAATATAIETSKIVATSDRAAVIAAITYEDIYPAKAVSFHLQGDNNNGNNYNYNGADNEKKGEKKRRRKKARGKKSRN